MRKMILMLLLAIAVMATGCGKENVNTTQEPQNTEEANTTQEPQNTEEVDATQEPQNTEEANITQEPQNTEEVDASQETQNTDAETDISANLDDYMASIKEQSDILKASLEKDPLTQYELNTKSQELYKLWDDALNYLWGELKNRLPEEEFTKLLDEQRIWIADKEKKVEEAGKEVEGGSMYPLVVNSQSATLTEERVYELYELLK